MKILIIIVSIVFVGVLFAVELVTVWVGGVARVNHYGVPSRIYQLETKGGCGD